MVLFWSTWFIWRYWGSYGPLLLLPKGVKVVYQGHTTRYLLLGAEYGDAPTFALQLLQCLWAGKRVASAHLKGFLDQKVCCDWVPSYSASCPGVSGLSRRASGSQGQRGFPDWTTFLLKWVTTREFKKFVWNHIKVYVRMKAYVSSNKPGAPFIK